MKLALFIVLVGLSWGWGWNLHSLAFDQLFPVLQTHFLFGAAPGVVISLVLVADGIVHQTIHRSHLRSYSQVILVCASAPTSLTVLSWFLGQLWFWSIG